MARLAMITDETTHTASIQTKAMLENIGHTPTVITTSAFETSGIDATLFDAIALVRMTTTTAVEERLKTYSDAGMPLIIGSPMFNTTLIQKLKLGNGVIADTGNVAVSSYQAETLANTHSIIEGYEDTTFAATVENSYAYRINLSDGSTWVGKRLAFPTSTPMDVSLGIVPKGTSAYGGTDEIKSNIVFAGFLYGGQGDYSETAKVMISRSITWATTASATEPEAETLVIATIQVKRGLKANLPTSALEGELVYATDTQELYIGTGTALRFLNQVTAEEVNALETQINTLITDVATVESRLDAIREGNLPQGNASVTYTYNATSGLLETEAWTGDIEKSVSYTYGNTAETADLIATETVVQGGVTSTKTFAYDAQGRVTATTITTA